MCIASEVTVGSIAVVKVGRNEVNVVVTEILPDGWKVRSQSTGREFEVRKIERLVSEAAETEATPEAKSEVAPEPETTPEAKPEVAPEAVCPPAEAGTVKAKSEKKPSLINAAAKVLEACGQPMNCKEMLAAAIAEGLWSPSGAKTPEQTLYSAIFREIKTAEKPRFKKSETKKGSFEFVPEA